MKHAKPVPAEPENAFWRELRQSSDRQPLTTLGAALQPFRCCGAPQLCGARCQEDELAAHLAVAEQMVREELVRVGVESDTPDPVINPVTGF